MTLALLLTLPMPAEDVSVSLRLCVHRCDDVCDRLHRLRRVVATPALPRLRFPLHSTS